MAPGAEAQGWQARCTAVVVIGGLVSATLLTLLVLPVLYAMVLSDRAAGAALRASAPQRMIRRLRAVGA